MSALTKAITAAIVAIAKSAWHIEAKAYQEHGYLYVKLTCEVENNGKHFKAEIMNRGIYLWIDDQKIGHPYCATSFSLFGWFAGPEERLGRHLLKMCRQEIRDVYRLFRAQEEQPDYQAQQQMLKQRQDLMALVSPGE